MIAIRTAARTGIERNRHQERTRGGSAGNLRSKINENPKPRNKITCTLYNFRRKTTICIQNRNQNQKF